MNKRTVYFVLILGLVTVALYSYPKNEPDTPSIEIPETNYTIGVMSATTTGDPYYRYLAKMAIKDINQYCIESGIDYRFDVRHASAEGQAQLSQENTQRFHEEGINLALGYGWSSQYCAGLNGYGEEHGMTIMSIGSTSPLGCCRKTDHGFRLIPGDLCQAVPLASAIIDLEYTNLLVISRSDSWADNIMDSFESEYVRRGGRIQHVVEYRHEAEDQGFKVYLDKLFKAYNQTDTPDDTAILAVSFSEIGGMLNEVMEYPSLMNTTWFGTDSTVHLEGLLEESGYAASRVNLIGPYITAPKSTDYTAMNQSFEDKFDTPLSIQLANVYDGIWLFALSVIETGGDNATDIAEILPIVASSYNGITGFIGFDEYGDRLPLDYEFWGVFLINGKPEDTLCGFYDVETGTLEWTEEW